MQHSTYARHSSTIRHNSVLTTTPLKEEKNININILNQHDPGSALAHNSSTLTVC